MPRTASFWGVNFRKVQSCPIKKTVFILKSKCHNIEDRRIVGLGASPFYFLCSGDVAPLHLLYELNFF